MVLNPIAIVAGYLLGSFPTAYIVTRLRRGIDIRDVDTGNMGAGAVLRVVGFWDGVAVLAGDAGKGAAAIFIAQALGVSQIWVLAAGFAAILGHLFPVYIGFRGGQGVAISLGVFLVLTPRAAMIALGVMGIVLLISRAAFGRHFFFAAACAGPVLPLAIWLLYASKMLTFYCLVVVMFLMFRNRRKLLHARTVTDATLRNGGVGERHKEV